MHEAFIEYHEVSGKVVKHVRFYTNPSSTPEVHLRFEDGTALSLRLQADLKLEGEYYRHDQGEVVTLRGYDPMVVK